MDRAVLIRGFRQVEADFNSGNGLDVDGTRVDVSVGAMGILEAILDFLCSHPRPLRLGDPTLQKKMVVHLQDAFDARYITVDFARRHPTNTTPQGPSSTSSPSARSQAMAGGKRRANDCGILDRGLRQVQADFRSGNGLDIDGTRHDVSLGAIDLFEHH